MHYVLAIDSAEMCLHLTMATFTTVHTYNQESCNIHYKLTSTFCLLMALTPVSLNLTMAKLRTIHSYNH